ncbi:conjugation peptidase TraF. Serine peptidase. MEROPS family S26C [Sphingomonas sp. YR710]|uniref:S26 family signal peptidase n=1 Tax=Sphingomonas sp. YR710 TaxID=1882773 RepID=UPI00088A6277|nr:S26 family signal peptidase [Sphingomonas sp. YR710]SDD79959.1 conjugation peptidase TraF. Serine peptidase. MEROPS family S26C [Sphingomonas sp. YR710]
MTRFGYIMTTNFAVMLIGGLSFIPITPKLIWNASASTPIGLYSVDKAPTLDIRDLVAVAAPEPLAKLLAERGYLPRGVPLLKHMAGLPGQQVCRTDTRITVNGITMGEALRRDRLGRDLPVWRGCRRVARNEIFLMNWSVRDSLDGRYFGPIPTSSIIGRAMPVWTDEDHSGHFKWRARTR